MGEAAKRPCAARGMGRAEGVIFSLCASCFTSSGLVIQKHAHNMGEWRISWMSRWRWFLGLLFVLFGGCFDSMALGSAPLIDIAPLSGITILLNSLMASYFLGERIRVVEIIATLMIFCGATLTSVFGARDVPAYSVPDLIDLLGRQSFTIYIAIVITLVIMSLLSLRAASGTNMEPQAGPFCWAVVAAGMGGVELILLKCVMEILTRTVMLGDDQFVHQGSYMLVGIFAIVAALQLYSLNLGLAVCDAIRLLPVYQSLLIINAVSGGGAYFNEFVHFTTRQWLLFPLGVTIVIFGALILGAAQEPTQASEAEVGLVDAKDGQVDAHELLAAAADPPRGGGPSLPFPSGV